MTGIEEKEILLDKILREKYGLSEQAQADMPNKPGKIKKLFGQWFKKVNDLEAKKWRK